MPLKKSKSPVRYSYKDTQHIAFFPLLILLFIVWVVYRFLFGFPVWFDETIGKAIFFGLPVWLYISITRSTAIRDTLALNKMHTGLLQGLALGGVFGFAAALASLWRAGVVIQAAPLFSSDLFWGEFFLALMTGFWETLFFYSWVMTVILEKFKHWSIVGQIIMTSVIFLLFHIPNTLLRFSSPQIVISQLFLLFAFAVGQALLFYRWRNAYALTISHAIWGMVLLIHTR